MKVMRFLLRNNFIILLAASFFILDYGVSKAFQPYIETSGRFVLNDFELTRRDHPEPVWDKVFFGNSVVVSAYREEESANGYVNLGIDYGVVRDLLRLLRNGDIKVGSELVIGLNDMTLYDHFETNPTYPSNRLSLEPYSYFQRTRLRPFFEQTVKQLLTDYEPDMHTFAEQEKSHYFGSLSRAELDERVKNSKYMNFPITEFSENFKALKDIGEFCRDNGIRLRVIWLPLNPDFQIPESIAQVRERLKEVCAENSIELYDMENALPVGCFHDEGHLNYEYGSHVFTKEVDKWLVLE